MVKDPVCGMDLDESEVSFLTRLRREETFYFCSEHCKKVFDYGPNVDDAKNLNWWQRFIKRLGESGRKRYGGKPPSCH